MRHNSIFGHNCGPEFAFCIRQLETRYDLAKETPSTKKMYSWITVDPSEQSMSKFPENVFYENAGPLNKHD